jgi:uncharacterized membrane protein HdeD (DUF308 family)
VLLALLGVLSFIVGLYALRNVLVTIAALALLLGIFWIVNGAMEVFTALSHRGMQGRGWTIFMGLLGVVAGVVVLVYPGLSLATLAVVLGFWLLVYGVMEFVLAFRLRSAGHAATRMAPGHLSGAVGGAASGRAPPVRAGPDGARGRGPATRPSRR